MPYLRLFLIYLRMIVYCRNIDCIDYLWQKHRLLSLSTTQSTDCLLYRPPIVRLLDFGLTFLGKARSGWCFLYTVTVPFYLGGASYMRLMTYMLVFTLAGHVLTFINRYFRNLLMTYIPQSFLKGHVTLYLFGISHAYLMTYMPQTLQKGHTTLYLSCESYTFLMTYMRKSLQKSHVTLYLYGISHTNS